MSTARCCRSAEAHDDEASSDRSSPLLECNHRVQIMVRRLRSTGSGRTGEAECRRRRGCRAGLLCVSVRGCGHGHARASWSWRRDKGGDRKKIKLVQTQRKTNGGRVEACQVRPYRRREDKEERERGKKKISKGKLFC